MKRIYVFSVAALSTLTVLKAQSSLVLTKGSDGTSVANGGYVHATTTPGIDTDTDINFKNISTAYTTYRVKKFNITLNAPSSSDNASSYFCTGINCYSPSQALSNPVDLAPNTSEVAKLYLTEASVVGVSLVRYLIYNTSNANDTISFYISYNNTSTSIHTNLKTFSNVSDVYPNPSTTKAQLIFTSNTALEHTTLTVINSLGVTVSKEEVNIVDGENTIHINVDKIATGIYFVRLTAGNSSIVKKFCVNK